MDLLTCLPHLAGLRVEQVAITEDAVTLAVAVAGPAPPARCAASTLSGCTAVTGAPWPLCGQMLSSVAEGSPSVVVLFTLPRLFLARNRRGRRAAPARSRSSSVLAHCLPRGLAPPRPQRLRPARPTRPVTARCARRPGDGARPRAASPARRRPRPVASSSRRRRRRRGAYIGVVTNLAQLRYRSHSHGPSCGRRRQWPSSNSVLKKFVVSQSTADAGRSPARIVPASGPAMAAPGPAPRGSRAAPPGR